MTTAKNYEKLCDSEKKKEDWMNSKWRPMMGWMYMAVCMADFVLFPVLWSLVQAAHGGSVQTQWNPITLAGAGLFHMAMGAILGIAAFGRTQEKMAGANNGGIGQSNGFGNTGGFGSQSMGGYGSAPLGGNNMSMGGGSFGNAPSMGGGYNSRPMASTGVMQSSSGKAMPIQPDQPLL